MRTTVLAISILTLTACAQLPVCPQVTISICPATTAVVAK